jgi:hypothetical protein
LLRHLPRHWINGAEHHATIIASSAKALIDGNEEQCSTIVEQSVKGTERLAGIPATSAKGDRERNISQQLLRHPPSH